MNGDDEPPVDAEWLRVADERESDMARLGSYPISGLLRRARRIAGVSQRELARRVGVSASTVARAESGSIEPTLSVFARMLAVAGLHLVMVDEGGHVVTPMRDIPDTRNGGGWRYPSHLDVILDPKSGEWWGATTTAWPGRRRPSTATTTAAAPCNGVRPGRCGRSGTSANHPRPTPSWTSSFAPNGRRGLYSPHRRSTPENST